MNSNCRRKEKIIMKKRELALIIDFGSPYNQTLTRKIRQLGVYSELHPHTISDEEIERLAPSVIILSGGPYYVNDEHRFRAPEAVFALDVPVLGIGYGMQLIAEHFGGEEIGRASWRERGLASVRAVSATELQRKLG